MTWKHLILILLVPFSEAKAIFYNIDMEVSWYLFSNHERQICMVIEDYSNIIIFGVVFYFYLYSKRDMYSIAIVHFLFVLNCLDFIHLGLYDMQYFVVIKIVLAFILTYVWYKLKPIY